MGFDRWYEDQEARSEKQRADDRAQLLSEIESLKAENERLRKALQSLADEDEGLCGWCGWVSVFAEKVLRGTTDE